MTSQAKRSSRTPKLTLERLDERVVPARMHPFFGHFNAAAFGTFPFAPSGFGMTGLNRGASRFPGRMNNFATQLGGVFNPTPISPVFPAAGGNFGVINTPNNAVAFRRARMFGGSAINTFNSPFGVFNPTPISPVFPIGGGNFGVINTPNNAVAFRSRPFFNFTPTGFSAAGSLNPTPISPVFPVAGGNFGTFNTPGNAVIFR